MAIAGVAVGVLLTGEATRAEACGACFAPVSDVTTVDSHRMVIALGTTETILWDQIVYSGEPADFAWVLPVPSPEVRVEVASPEFFASLDQGTAPTISPANPLQLFCPDDGWGGCGDDSGDYTNSPSDGVTVYDQGVVGPYETVTVGAESRNALYDWLTANGYEITPASLPVMEHYLDLGYVFVALRLRPGVGVQAMTPVRVRYPGYMGTFPLKGVVVGTKGIVNLSLWVIAEQRYEARNYATVRVNEDELTWNWSTNTSNYSDVFDDAILDAGGRAWVVEYADSFAAIPITAAGGADASIVRSLSVNPYVTRLRTRMRTEYIDADLQLTPAADSSRVSNFLLAPRDLNRPSPPDCDTGAPTARARQRASGRRCFWCCSAACLRSAAVGRRQGRERDKTNA